MNNELRQLLIRMKLPNEKLDLVTVVSFFRFGAV